MVPHTGATGQIHAPCIPSQPDFMPEHLSDLQTGGSHWHHVQTRPFKMKNANSKIWYYLSMQLYCKCLSCTVPTSPSPDYSNPSQQPVTCLNFSLCGTLLGSQKCASVLFLASRLLFDECPTKPCTTFAPHEWFRNDERCSARPSGLAEWHVQHALSMTACTKWMGRAKTCKAPRPHTPNPRTNTVMKRAMGQGNQHLHGMKRATLFIHWTASSYPDISSPSNCWAGIEKSPSL